MKTERIALGELTLDPANARKHEARNIAAIMDSLKAFGQQKPIVVDRRGVVIAGNGTLEAAKRLGWDEIAIVRTDLDPTQATAYGIADNRTAELAEWDSEVLTSLLDSLNDEMRDLLHFDEKELDALLPKHTVEVVEDEVPEKVEPRTKPGDLWLLGDHRLLCGDSTSLPDANRLFGQETATMLHADPPYGMGKEKDGVANDNLYNSKLDAFQMDWWRAWRPRIADNASAYIWGNAPDLWRLWYVGGLSEFERLTMRNEIVWDKGGAAAGGVSLEGSEGPRRYPSSTERCLFFMLGEQGFNINADNYWEGWEPIRAYLVEQMERCGWTSADLNRITGTKMAVRWVTRSQWAFITEEHYLEIQRAAREHDAFKREHDELKQEFYATRAHFDNTHDNMTDVWSFPRVTGEDRHGHATPKPVQMMARAIKSSSQEGDIVAVPFGGTGPELIAAEQLGRKCYGMEISPAYCDIIVQRWENLTGQSAVLNG
jgi:DNA modification methylase